MTWCINDVTKIYGEAGLRRRSDHWTDAEVPVVYPDGGPAPAAGGPEVIPTPANLPVGPTTPALQAPRAQAPASQTPAPQPANQGPTPPMPTAPQPSGAMDNSPLAPGPTADSSRYPGPQPYNYGAPSRERSAVADGSATGRLSVAALAGKCGEACRLPGPRRRTLRAGAAA